MKHFLSVLIMLLMVSCTKNDIFQPKEITAEFISKGFLFNTNYNPTKHNRVFYSENEWKNFIDSVWNIANIPTSANVDFKQNIVIASFDKPRTNGGHSIDIISITENELTIVVVVEKLKNGDATFFPTRPYHFVKIPKSDKPIVFE